MMIGVALLMLGAVDPEVRTQPPSYTSSEPTEIEVGTLALDRAIEEFVSICLMPDLRAEAVKQAISASSLDYGDAPPDGDGSSFDWRSTTSSVSLRLSADVSQCVVGTGLTGTHTRDEVISLLKPKIEALLNRSLKTSDNGVFVEWKAAASRDLKRVTVMLPSDEVGDVLTIAFDRTAPGVRERLQRSVR